MEGLSIYYQNVRGLRTDRKKDEFFRNFIGCDYDIVSLTETWFNELFNSYSYFTENYFVFRKDKGTPGPDDVRGGGTLLAVKKKFQVHRRFDLDFNNIECLWIELKLSPECTLLISTHYLPCTIDTDLLENYSNFITDSIDISLYKIICLGDYNAPMFNWSLGISENPNSYIKKKSLIISALISNLGLVQHNNLRINEEDNILDLVCSNFSDELKIIREDELIWLDYEHPSLLITLSLPVFKKTFVPIVRKNYPKGNYGGLFLYLAHYNFSDSTDPDVLVADVTEAVSNGIQNFIPDKVIRPSKYPYWFSSNLISLLRLKEKYHKKLKKCPYNLYFKQSFSKFRYLCKKTHTFDEKRFKYKLESDLRNNPRFFWKYLKTQYKSSHEICLLQNGSVLPDEDVPNVFADQFSSIYNASSSVPLFSQRDVRGSESVSLEPPVISVADVVKAAKSLKSSCVAGSDNVPSFIVKGCINVLAQPLCKIFNICLKNCKFPSGWKTSTVVAVPKNSNVSCVKNYRGISLLCNFSKIFEKILVNHVSFHVNNLISPHQHGFLKGRSTATNLVSFLEFAAPPVLNQRQIDTVYFDLSKAFDVVNHELLVLKLQNIGLSPRYAEFLKSYVTGRTFRVKSGKFLSSEHTVPSGVPQGSNISPLLFIIFLDDIKHVISSHFEIYADDLKISRAICEPEDAIYLQRDIDSIVNWCNNNGMKCNVDKTVVVSFTRKHTTYFFDYKLEGSKIPRKLENRDLGVIFDCKLNFNCHIEKLLSTVRRSSSLVYWICKNFRNPSTCTLLYSALVRSKLEYCSEAWAGLGMVDSSKIEQIQKNFLRKVTFRAYGQSKRYAESLTIYNLSKLCIRRTIKDVTFLYKIINHLITCQYLLSKIVFNVPRTNSRNFRPFKLPITQQSVVVPLNRMMIILNKYPALDHSLSLTRFVTELTAAINESER